MASPPFKVLLAMMMATTVLGNAKDAGERLGDTSVYQENERAFDFSPWKWQHLLVILVFVVVFAVWRYVYEMYMKLLRCGGSYSLTNELVVRSNKASAIDFASFLLSLGIVTAGTLDGKSVEETETGKFFYTYFAYQALSFALLILARTVNDVLVLRAVANTNSIVDNSNVAAACVEAGATVASALVIGAAASGNSPRDHFGDGVLATMLYWVLGQVVLVVYVQLIDLLTRVPLPRALGMLSPGSIRDASGSHTKGSSMKSQRDVMKFAEESELTSTADAAGPAAAPGLGSRNSFSALQQAAEHNVATGISIGLELVAVGLLLQAPIYAGWSLLAWIIWLSLSLFVIMPAFHVFFDMVVLHGVKLAENINVERNWGAAILVGSLKVATALVLNAVYKRNCRTSSYHGGDPGTCESDAPTDADGNLDGGDTLGDLLSTSAVPDIFSGRSVIDLLVFVGLVCAAKAWFWARFVMRDGTAAAGKLTKEFSISATLADPHNNAVALSFASFCLGGALVMVGVLDCPDDTAGWQLGNLIGWTAIGMVLMVTSQTINDAVLMHGQVNSRLLFNDNIAVACLEAGSHLSCGLIIRACISGGAGSFWEGLCLTLVFWALAQLLFVIIMFAYRAATAFDDHAELLKGNVATGASAGLALVGIAYLMSKAILYSGALAIFVPIVAVGVLLLGLLRVVIDRVLLPGAKLDDELKAGNWGAALVEGCSAVALAMMLAVLLPQDPRISTCGTWSETKAILDG